MNPLTCETCDGDGFCTVHGMRKAAHWTKLCRTDPAYRAAYDAGRGPGQVPPLQDATARRQPAYSAATREEQRRRLMICAPCDEINQCAKTACAKRRLVETGTCRRGKWSPIWPRPAKGDGRMRVGLLTPTLLFGGAERWVAALAVGLDAARFDVVGVAVRDRGRIFPAIAETIRKRPGCALLDGAGSFIRVAKQCDVLIAWGLSDLSMLAGYQGCIVMVGHGHCDWTVHAIRECLPYITDCAAVSRHAAESFRAAGHLSEVAIIHNGIDVDRCAARPGRSREEVRAEWGIRLGEIAVGYVGRLSPEKNPLAAVRAVAALNGLPQRARRFADGNEIGNSSLRPSTSSAVNVFRAVIVGGGISEDREIEAARQSVPNLVYRPAVEQVGDIYRALDCFILASRSEGFSLALAEAWYCGCPTVATPVGATELPELHGDLYVPVPVGATADQLAAAVRLALAAENLPTVARAARVVAQHYTAAAMCRRWETYLEKIARTQPSPRSSASSAVKLTAEGAEAQEGMIYRKPAGGFQPSA